MAEQKKEKRHDEKANNKAGLNLPKWRVQIVFALNTWQDLSARPVHIRLQTGAFLSCLDVCYLSCQKRGSQGRFYESTDSATGSFSDWSFGRVLAEFVECFPWFDFVVSTHFARPSCILLQDISLTLLPQRGLLTGSSNGSNTRWPERQDTGCGGRSTPAFERHRSQWSSGLQESPGANRRSQTP